MKEINISNIKVDNYPLNLSTLKLVDHIRKNGYKNLPPIAVVLNKNGQYLIKDGRHRVTAFKLLEIKTIKAKVIIEWKV